MKDNNPSTLEENTRTFTTNIILFRGMMVEGGKKKEHELANKILQQASQPQEYDPEEDVGDGKGKEAAFTGSGIIPFCVNFTSTNTFRRCLQGGEGIEGGKKGSAEEEGDHFLGGWIHHRLPRRQWE